RSPIRHLMNLGLVDSRLVAAHCVWIDPLAIPAAVALEMATIGGARALKLDHLVGSLEPGKRADVVIIDLDEDNLVPLYDPVSHLAYAVEAADVRTVIVDGRIVLRDGVLTTADEREIRRQVRALAMGIGSFRGGATSKVDIEFAIRS